MLSSSSYYRNKIEEYKNIMSQISGLFSYSANCSALVQGGSSYMEGLIISGEPIDKGNIAKLSSTLGSIDDALNTIIAECMSKISENEGLLQQAIVKEQKLAEENASDGGV